MRLKGFKRGFNAFGGFMFCENCVKMRNKTLHKRKKH